LEYFSLDLLWSACYDAREKHPQAQLEHPGAQIGAEGRSREEGEAQRATIRRH